MARGSVGASGRLTLGALLIAGAWVVGYWVTPAPGSREVQVEFGSPPPPAPGAKAPIVVHDDPVIPPDPSPTSTLPPPTAPVTVPQDPPPKPKAPGPADLPRIVPPKFNKYLSVEGDTFATIARRFLGDDQKWTIIAQANPLMDPNKLRPGTVVMVPRDPENIQGRENLAGYVVHTVKSGDSLSTIAKQYYGKASLWGVIAAANPDVDPNRLKLGAKIRIPPAPAPDSPPAN